MIGWYISVFLMGMAIGILIGEIVMYFYMKKKYGIEGDI